MDGYLGTIMMCGFPFTPSKYAACNGAIIPINQNMALYSLLGVSFGGSPNTNFGLPDLRGRVAMSSGRGPGLEERYIGQFFGDEWLTLDQTQMPSHKHNVTEIQTGKSLSFNSTATLNANKTTNDSSTPENSFNAILKSGMASTPIYASSADTTMNSAAIDVETTGTLNANNLVTTDSGGGQRIPFFQPSLVLNFVICVDGLYPNRS